MSDSRRHPGDWSIMNSRWTSPLRKRSTIKTFFSGHVTSVVRHTHAFLCLVGQKCNCFVFSTFRALDGYAAAVQHRHVFLPLQHSISIFMQPAAVTLTVFPVFHVPCGSACITCHASKRAALTWGLRPDWGGDPFGNHCEINSPSAWWEICADEL